jgi:hypothetical protein
VVSSVTTGAALNGDPLFVNHIQKSMQSYFFTVTHKHGILYNVYSQHQQNITTEVNQSDWSTKVFIDPFEEHFIVDICTGPNSVSCSLELELHPNYKLQAIIWLPITLTGVLENVKVI